MPCFVNALACRCFRRICMYVRILASRLGPCLMWILHYRHYALRSYQSYNKRCYTLTLYWTLECAGLNHGFVGIDICGNSTLDVGERFYGGDRINSDVCIGSDHVGGAKHIFIVEFFYGGERVGGRILVPNYWLNCEDGLIYGDEVIGHCKLDYDRDRLMRVNEGIGDSDYCGSGEHMGSSRLVKDIWLVQRLICTDKASTGVGIMDYVVRVIGAFISSTGIVFSVLLLVSFFNFVADRCDCTGSSASTVESWDMFSVFVSMLKFGWMWAHLIWTYLSWNWAVMRMLVWVFVKLLFLAAGCSFVWHRENCHFRIDVIWRRIIKRMHFRPGWDIFKSCRSIFVGDVCHSLCVNWDTMVESFWWANEHGLASEWSMTVERVVLDVRKRVSVYTILSRVSDLAWNVAVYGFISRLVGTGDNMTILGFHAIIFKVCHRLGSRMSGTY